jgi:outer membrane protein TolC
MRKRSVSAIVLGLLTAGCGPGAWNAYNPLSQAPTTPYANWSPCKGNNLISSRYCQTMLPDSFGQNELSLAELLDIALQNNPSTKITWAQARSAAGTYGQSLAAYYPNIQFDASYIRERSSTIIQGTTFSTSGGASSESGGGANQLLTFYETIAGPDVIITYTLLDFGTRSSAAEMARQALYYADWTHNQQIQNVLQTVMNDYYSYLYQLSLLHSDEKDLENAQASLDAANQRFALGLAALGDVAQARTHYLQNKINVTSQQQTVENSFAMLAVDLGLPANIPFKVQQIPQQMAVEPVLDCVAVLVDRAQRQRQDFLASEANVYSKAAAVKNAEAQRYPIVNGTFDIGRTYYNGGLHEKYHFIGQVSLTFPIFAGFNYINGIRVAKANLDQAKAQMLQTELSVIQNVSTTHKNVETSAKNLRYSEEYLQAAQLEFDIALKSYKAGTETILTVLSAQASLADARTKQAGAQYSWYSSLAALAYATGALCCPPCESQCEVPRCPPK